MALKEDYKDAVFAGLRKYKMLDNGDGTVSPVDMTEYEAAGDKFGAKDVNAITKTVNATGEIIADDNDEFKPDQKYVIGRIVIYDNKTWRFKVDHEPGEWDERQVERTNILGVIAEQNKNFEALNEKTKEVYKSEAAFAVSQTVHMSCIENDSENSVYLISSYRYAFAGSMVLTRKDIVEGNWGEGFTIFAQNPEHYWVFKLTSNFDLTLVTNHECGLPYVSVTRL